MNTLPSLADLLAVTCHAEIARRIERPRAFVWRLAHGQVLRDDRLIAELARALHRDESYVRAICANDARRERERRSAS